VVQRHEDHADKVGVISALDHKLNLSFIRRKLSKLVSQLNTTSIKASRISNSPAVLRQRKVIKVSKGSVAASSDNDWGSDFEDATDTVIKATDTVKNATETIKNATKVFYENLCL
jgi:hypothetical protein